MVCRRIPDGSALLSPSAAPARETRCPPLFVSTFRAARYDRNRRTTPKMSGRRHFRRFLSSWQRVGINRSVRESPVFTRRRRRKTWRAGSGSLRFRRRYRSRRRACSVSSSSSSSCSSSAAGAGNPRQSLRRTTSSLVSGCCACGASSCASASGLDRRCRRRYRRCRRRRRRRHRRCASSGSRPRLLFRPFPLFCLDLSRRLLFCRGNRPRRRGRRKSRRRTTRTSNSLSSVVSGTTRRTSCASCPVSCPSCCRSSSSSRSSCSSSPSGAWNPDRRPAACGTRPSSSGRPPRC
mmetsp:Transcript_16079/g.37276  ORF Transcript_16079/g.37276 Transcript_16079/m.37276 type:complete len:293 (-) Transcript_16079:539-1417(-)